MGWDLVWSNRERETDMCEREMKVQRQHTCSLTPPASSSGRHVCALAEELWVCEDLLQQAPHTERDSGCALCGFDITQTP